MNYLSVCSGIEAATCAWHQLGWTPSAFSEIEKFPSAVLAHHYQDTQNLGDMTNYKEWDIDQIDLLVGGTPCQSFSVAGLRKGLDDPRGNLCLVYLGIAERFRPRWILWENVPGVLSSGRGRDFGSFLGAMAELGYGWAYRVLDAQYFGVPQRRRRVFVVGYLGDWRRAAAALFERHSLQGYPPPSREKREEVAPTIRSGATNNGRGHGARSGDSKDELIIPCFTPSGLGDNRPGCGTLRSNGGDLGGGSENLVACWWSGDSVTATITKCSANQMMPDQGNFMGIVSPTVTSKWAKGSGGPAGAECGNIVQQKMKVRRITPRECERLQGFPDDYTNIPWRGKMDSPDGPRYKALGNSMAVPVMKWLGERIQMVDMI